MDSDTDSVSSRLNVVETGRRRRWSEREKERIVLESSTHPVKAALLRSISASSFSRS